jgi:EpsI family protein
MTFDASRRTVIVAGLVAIAAGGLRLAARADTVPAATRLTALPQQVGGWSGHDDPRLDRETEQVLDADAYVSRTYTRAASEPVSLFVAFYATQRSGHTIHSPLNCLPGTGWSWVERGQTTIPGAPALTVNRNVAERGGQRVLVDYWYQSRGRVVANEYRNKLLLIRDALTVHRSDGALVRVTTPILSDEQRAVDRTSAFIQALYAPLTEHLPE